jgi:acetyl-CoA carboxylase carboxyltransferase component
LGEPVGEDLSEAIEKTRADYERSLDARWSAARGYTDAIIDPRDTRATIATCLEACAQARS